MFLKSVEIRHIRSIEHIVLDFRDSASRQGNRKWTIFLGENGTGKSTVLRSIGLVLAGSDALPFLLGEPDSWIRNGSDQASIAATLQTARNEERCLEIQFKQGMDRSGFIEHNRKGLDQLDSALAHTQRSYFVVGYGALRRLAMHDMNISRRGNDPERAQSLATLFDLDATLNPLQSWAMGLEYRDGKRGTRIIENAMNGLLPDVSFSRIDRHNGDLLFTTPDGDVPLSMLSDGYQNVAAWIGDLLYRITESFDDYKNPLKTRGLLLIDEIDAHLHPKWQRQLRKYIETKLPEFQIIGTTHSVLTAQQLEADECVILNRNEKSNAVSARTFPGVPAELQAHELLEIGFNVETLDSVRLSNDKHKYRSLYRKKSKTTRDRQELQRLAEQFSVLPERDLSFRNEAIIESQQKQRKTIEDLLAQIEGMKSGKLMLKKKTKKRVVKKKAVKKSPTKKKSRAVRKKTQ
ncbi:AAA family ATPase [Candidatus Thiodiazotropha sp. CDECU1]|uniref:AAA family ATPase n=1 Tax=Candidatus Thiodiazotropha sp. CDECU1 TaxID=3065865 RepID=UPI002931B1C2|nr:AAA family ATPase [Candidatus Thiodiazotropha sp. CDECU1]